MTPGTYTTNPLTVSLNDALAGATIYYTLDGSTPTTNSLVYNAPITLTATTTVTAMAFKSGYAPSLTLSGQFVIPLIAATPVITPRRAAIPGLSR